MNFKNLFLYVNRKAILIIVFIFFALTTTKIFAVLTLDSLGVTSDGVLTLNSATNLVGIGTTTPVKILDVYKSDTSAILTSGTLSTLRITNPDTTAGNYSSLEFATNSNTAVMQGMSRISAVYTSHAGGAQSADLAFLLRNAGSIGEKLRITSQGNLVLPSTGAIYLGSSTFIHTFGTNNLFLGVGSGNLTTSGTGENTVLGHTSGANLTTGYQNTLVGYNSGNSINTGYGNTFIGRSTGTSTQDGYFNGFIGIGAGSSNTTGYQNNFMGAFTGSANTTGGNNTFIGDSAGRLNTIGLSNTFIGRAAGDANVDGNYNVFNGHQSGFRNIGGDFNTFIGDTAGMWNTTGDQNTFIGNYAGATIVDANGNVSGSKNTYIGYGSGPASTTQLSGSTAIGNSALVNASNSMVLGGTGADAVNVGIGTTTPTSKLQVVGLPVFANNAAAITGGLTAGAFYRTGADPDPVMVVH